MEDQALICPICGEATQTYFKFFPRQDRLCKEHARMINYGEIKELFIDPFTSKILNADVPDKNALKKANELTCIICNQHSNGRHFCLSCYHKYKDRAIDIRIANCSNTKILDQYGNLSIECDDGRKVRSRAEALISNFFYNNKIRSIYEKTVYYTENGVSKTIHPDFYLPDFDVYIEYNEIKKKSYLKSKEYTQKIYNQLGYKVIIMDEQDLNSIAGCLKPKLGIN